jgi:hypothetical protein
VPTTGISLVREQTEAMRLPRFLWVPFELGRPFGAPGEREFQRRVLHAALGLLEHDHGPSVLEDFPDDAPATDEDVVWACPVSFTPDPDAAPDLVAEARAEMSRLAAWAELAPPPTPNSGMEPDDMVTLLGSVAAGDDAPGRSGDLPFVEAVRLAADDLRTWYLHAAAQQPGSADTRERMTWFWRQTVMGRLLGAVAARLLVDPDPMLRAFADRGLVPRDHWSAIVPDSSTWTGAPDD